MFKLVMSLLLVATTGPTTPVAAAAPAAGVIRVDQAGFAPGESKRAYLMSTAPAPAARFTVLDAAGRPVLHGRVGPSRGSWNAAYPAVYPIDLDRLDRPGTYRIRVGALVSPGFRVRPAGDLYGELVRDGVTFFRTQRDRAHRNDAHATVYATPHFATEDVIADADLTPIGGPVDVAGGWYDAGDYLKMTHTTAYGVISLLAAARALGPAAGAGPRAAARAGVDWLGRAWDQRTATLRLQVGIGSGNEAGTFTGDHDLWRLPGADDRDTDPADRYAAAHRPVFDAAAPGAPISPNLAGRVAAAFALAAQLDAARHPARARAELRAATSLYARADVKSPPEPLVTALPNEFYPEDTWHDDMELGATEIALALHRLGRPGARAYVRDAAGFARGYLAAETGDTFNLYDVSALAHADLVTAIRQTGGGHDLAAGPGALVGDLRRQLRTGADRAAADPFHAGGVYTDFDVASHTFGLIATEALYRSASGDTSFAAFATRQRDWLLGANAWGTSFMIGVGSTFPRCPQHQIANLTGRTLTGAVVNGPNDPELFADGLGDPMDEMVTCPADGKDRFAAFTGHGSRYVDDVRAWQTDEPALDMTGSAVLAAASQSVATSSW
ncbi:glycoside hydrolase family 9 protein [Actinoplanes sp. CA-030573]|uniref:glycoside hydrolase family 9 protein n=1 Tax=Actinoplanes sp. CA-030573 TaxID=3239898 RepID=UPI003D9466BC